MACRTGGYWRCGCPLAPLRSRHERRDLSWRGTGSRLAHWSRCACSKARNDPMANYLLSQIRNAFGDHITPQTLAERAVALDGNVAKYHRQYAEVLGVTAQHSNMLQQ